MTIRALCALALALLLAAPATAQELRTHRGPSVTIGYGSRTGVHASVQFGGSRNDVCAPQPRRVWVPGYWERVWVDPVYAWRRQSCGTSVRVLVRAGYWSNVWRPGYWAEPAPSYSVRGHRGAVRRAY